MLSTIENLREVVRLCLAGEPLSDELSGWLGSSLDEFLNHRTTSVDDALGLRFPQGGIPWWREAAIRKRDAALRELAHRFFADLRPTALAREIRTLSVRYGASAWRHDKSRNEMPGHYQGTIKECLWRAFASEAAMPISDRQLRTILAE